ncbi:MAG: N-glycosylase/DNA lyase [Candidatus Hadarchaeota archaeon]|nr:N-glycosylase/DNA lyase [Candidatus Hadarchaeota archaeon]
MHDLVCKLKSLKSGEVGEKVRRRIEEFGETRSKGDERWFSELCFCILTANSSARLGIRIQEKLGEKGFLALSLPELTRELRAMGHRFYRKRAEFITEARDLRRLKEIIRDLSTATEAREWLVKNVKGLGYKEASHFLRNIGYDGVAILDRHVLRTLHKEGIIERVPHHLSKSDYLSIEQKLREVAEKAGLTLAELDLYLWYMATGEILK